MKKLIITLGLCHILVVQAAQIAKVENKEADKQLLEAAQSGNLEQVKKALTAGANINAKDKYQWTALHHASSHGGDIEVVKELISAKAIIDSTDEWKMTPLHWVTKNNYNNNDDVVIRALIEAKANVDAVGYNNWTALHYAACYSENEAVKILIAVSANIDAENCAHETPLHLAINKSNTEMIKALVSAGADYNKIIKNQFWDTNREDLKNMVIKIVKCFEYDLAKELQEYLTQKFIKVHIPQPLLSIILKYLFADWEPSCLNIEEDSVKQILSNEESTDQKIAKTGCCVLQ